jgi:ABC-type transport system involved in cytochrome bd biosynthesis fused ATPase/permease subunit
MKTNTSINIVIVSLLSIALSIMIIMAISHGLTAIFCAVCTIIIASLFFNALRSYGLSI